VPRRPSTDGTDTSLVTTLRQVLDLLGPGFAGRWALVIGLALVVSAFEVVGAGVVFALLGRITTEASGFEIPLVGDLRAVFPGASEPVLAAVIGATLAVFFVLRAVVIVAQRYLQHRVAENAGARLATRLLEGYLAMPYTFHLQRNSAELVRNSYDNVQHFVREALLPGVKLVSESMIIVGLLAVLVVTAPSATVAAVAVLGPFAWLLLRIVHPRIKGFGRVSQERSRSSLQTLHESLGGFRDIRILGRSRSFVRRFHHDRRELARARYLKATAKELPRVSVETLLVLFILGFLGVNVLLGGGALEALPVLGLFGYVAVRLQQPLHEVMGALNTLKFTSAGIELLHADLAMHDRGAVDDGEVRPRPLRHQLELRGVGFRYPGAVTDALQEVDLTVRAGEFVGIVGPTGGGKSTLVDLMLGLLPRDRGAILLDGDPLEDDLAGWQASLGVVHQSVFLADTSLRENVALGVLPDEIDDELVREALELAQLSAFVDALPHGLDTTIGEDGVRVSGGQRQRLAIARALYTRPSVLFFDEGTSALDDATERELMAALEGLRGERTIVVVAHRLSTVRRCDRVVLVDDGRVVDVAPFDELAARHVQLLRSAT
jgi:ATP-binding cassette, subfamily B, bacterial PglK